MGLQTQVLIWPMFSNYSAPRPKQCTHCAGPAKKIQIQLQYVYINYAPQWC